MACSITSNIFKGLIRRVDGRELHWHLIYPQAVVADITSFCRFQEQVLSIRTIVFVGDRVFFRCQQNVWGEDLIFDQFPTIKNKAFESGNGVPTMSYSDGGSRSVVDKYISLLSHYHGRDLTSEDDSINAFQGVLRQLCIKLKSDHLCGIPTIIFDLGLLFWHMGPAKRRRGFPSWSWAGWSGYLWVYDPAEEGEDTNQWLETGALNIWAVRRRGAPRPELVCNPNNPLSNGRPLAASDIGYRSFECQCAVLSAPSLASYLESLSLEVPHEVIPESHPVLQFRARTIIFPTLAQGEKRINFYQIIDCASKVCGCVALEVPHVPEPPYEFLMLSKADKGCKNFHPYQDPIHAGRPFVWVMLITRSGPLTRRAGLGFVHFDQAPFLVPPGITWGEILLA